MSLMTCPFCCFNGMPPLTGRLCPPTQATSLGQILIVLNRWNAIANGRRSIPLKSTYIFKKPPGITRTRGAPTKTRLRFSRLYVLRASFAVGENAPNGCDQPIEFDRRGIELVTPSGNRLFTLAGERVRGQNDYRDVAGLRIAFEPSRGLPAVDDGHFEVHQDDIWLLGRRHLAPFLASSAVS